MIISRQVCGSQGSDIKESGRSSLKPDGHFCCLEHHQFYSLTTVRNLPINWWAAWRSTARHWRLSMWSCATQKARWVSNKLTKIAKICCLLGCKIKKVTVGIQRTPYKALFGCKAKVGLTISSLPQDVLRGVQTHPMEEKEAFAQNMDENAIHYEGNQSGGEDVLST